MYVSCASEMKQVSDYAWTPAVYEVVIEGTDGEEGKYGSATNAKRSGIFSRPLRGNEDSRPI